jgi:hypothetical protein
MVMVATQEMLTRRPETAGSDIQQPGERRGFSKFIEAHSEDCANNKLPKDPPAHARDSWHVVKMCLHSEGDKLRFVEIMWLDDAIEKPGDGLGGELVIRCMSCLPLQRMQQAQ